MRRKTFGRNKFRGRPNAKVRRTWVTNIRASWCNPYLFDLNACSDGRSGTSVIFQIVNQTMLQDEFSDSAAVKRVVGDLFFNPLFNNGPPDIPDQIQSHAAIQAFQAFVGLRKRTVNAAGATTNVHPLDDDEDYGDARWLRTWHHANQSTNGLSYQLATATHDMQYPSTTNNTHTEVASVEACIPFTSGTGTLCIATDTSYDCVPCPGESTFEFQQTSVSLQRPWHFHMDIRRKRGMYLKENEELVLQVDMAHPFLTTWMANDPAMQVFGGIKALLQY